MATASILLLAPPVYPPPVTKVTRSQAGAWYPFPDDKSPNFVVFPNVVYVM